MPSHSCVWQFKSFLSSSILLGSLDLLVGGKALMCLDGFLDFNVLMGLRAGCYGWLDPVILFQGSLLSSCEAMLSACLAKLSELPAMAFCCRLVMLLIVVDYAADTGVCLRAWTLFGFAFLCHIGVFHCLNF
jgi:hypothetical protein